MKMRRSRWITLSSNCLILHILRKPNSLIANYIAPQVQSGVEYEWMPRYCFMGQAFGRGEA